MHKKTRSLITAAGFTDCRKTQTKAVTPVGAGFYSARCSWDVYKTGGVEPLPYDSYSRLYRHPVIITNYETGGYSAAHTARPLAARALFK